MCRSVLGAMTFTAMVGAGASLVLAGGVEWAYTAAWRFWPPSPGSEPPRNRRHSPWPRRRHAVLPWLSWADGVTVMTSEINSARAGSRFPVATGTGSTTGGCSATCARARAGCARASVACASSAAGSTTRSCSPPTAAPAGSASTRSRRSRSTTSCPAAPVLSFGTAGCNLACRFCQNWDISKSREIDRLADAAAPEAIAEAAVRLGLPQRGDDLQRPGDLPRVRRRRGRRLPRPGDQGGRGHRRLHRRRAAARAVRAHGRGQRGPQGVHRGLLPPRLGRAPAAGAGHARVPAARAPTSGSRSPPC